MTRLRMVPRCVLALAFLSACADVNAPAPATNSMPQFASAVPVPITGKCDVRYTLDTSVPNQLGMSGTGSCQMSHLGRTAVQVTQTADFGQARVSGSVTFTAANGDQLRGQVSAPVTGGQVTQLQGIVAFTGGTGRFATARGSATFTSAGNSAQNALIAYSGSIEYGQSASGTGIGQVSLDVVKAVTQSVGVEGGTISTTSSAGVQYRLVIPAGALMNETLITMTPIAAAQQLGLSGGLLGGVEFGPAGLRFAKPASLEIAVTQSPPAGLQLFAFSYEGHTTPLVPELTTHAGAVVVIPVAHFSGAVVGYGSTLDWERIVGPNVEDVLNGSTTAEPYKAAISFEFVVAPAPDAAAIEQFLRDWFNNVVLNALAAATNDQLLIIALGEYWIWDTWQEAALNDLSKFATELSAWDQGMALKLRLAVQGNLAVCGAQHSIEALANVIYWQERAEELGLATSSFQLDHASIQQLIAAQCARVVLSTVDLPNLLDTGTQYTLHLEFGLELGAPPVLFTGGSSGIAFDVLLSSIGVATTIQGGNGFTDGNGFFDREITPDAEGTVELLAKACLVLPGRTQATFDVCHQESVTRQALATLSVSPGTVTLSPGQTAQFTAQMGGSSTNVTWTATGGTIDANGLYTAGAVAGTYTVQATSVANPNHVGGAQVTISGQALLDLTGQWKLKVVGNPDQTHCGPVNSTNSFGIADLEHHPHPQHPEGILVGSWEYRGGFCGANVSSASGTMSAIVATNVDTDARELLNWTLRIDSVSNTQVCVAFIDEIRQGGAVTLNPFTQVFSSFELAVGDVNNALCPPQITFTITLQRCTALQVTCTSIFFPAARTGSTVRGGAVLRPRRNEPGAG